MFVSHVSDITLDWPFQLLLFKKCCSRQHPIEFIKEREERQKLMKQWSDNIDRKQKKRMNDEWQHRTSRTVVQHIYRKTDRDTSKKCQKHRVTCKDIWKHRATCKYVNIDRASEKPSENQTDEQWRITYTSTLKAKKENRKYKGKNIWWKLIFLNI